MSLLYAINTFFLSTTHICYFRDDARKVILSRCKSVISAIAAICYIYLRPITKMQKIPSGRTDVYERYVYDRPSRPPFHALPAAP